MRNLIARLLGRPVLEALIWIFGKLRELAYRDIQGRHYQYKTNPIDIIEGPGAERWLSLSNVRRSINDIPEFGVLQRLHPDAVHRELDQRTERIEARALYGVLAKAQDLRTRRFVLWLQRVVIFPADKKASHER